MKIIILCSVLILFSGHKALGQEELAPPVISFCDILRNPEKYHGSEVTVRATLRYGFEWKEIYCLGCRKEGKVYLLIDDSKISKKAGRNLKKLPKEEATVNAIFKGMFENRGKFRGTRFTFILQEIDEVKVLTKQGVPPQSLPKKHLKKVCGMDPDKCD
ncbi:MAG: hypothetical protein J5I65_06975 [Aridibacter famidurans]|nr:hypothetical protein [Aridibacter famidurans]